MVNIQPIYGVLGLVYYYFLFYPYYPRVDANIDVENLSFS